MKAEKEPGKAKNAPVVPMAPPGVVMRMLFPSAYPHPKGSGRGPSPNLEVADAFAREGFFRDAVHQQCG